MAMQQIAIKYVNPAKEGKKYGSIKDTAGNTYWVPKEMVAGFRAGTTVEVPLSQQTWGQNVVQVVAGHASSTPVANNDAGGGSAPSAPYPATVTPDPTAANIFVTGVVGRAMGSGKYETQDIALLTQAAVEAWKNHIAGKL